ncbi:MAG TPA: MarR family transcriptional regulator [Opitutaceae bacterium]
MDYAESDQASTAPASASEGTSLPLQTLVQIARQSGTGNPATCEVFIELLATGRVLRNEFRRVLAALDLSETKFSALVTLYALDPLPSNAADLAYHAETSRAAMTEILDYLGGHDWIQRERIGQDRRIIHVRLTEAGRDIAARAIRRILDTASDYTNTLSLPQREALAAACAALRHHLLPQSS